MSEAQRQLQEKLRQLRIPSAQEDQRFLNDAYKGKAGNNKGESRKGGILNEIRSGILGNIVGGAKDSKDFYDSAVGEYNVGGFNRFLMDRIGLDDADIYKRLRENVKKSDAGQQLIEDAIKLGPNYLPGDFTNSKGFEDISDAVDYRALPTKIKTAQEDKARDTRVSDELNKDPSTMTRPEKIEALRVYDNKVAGEEGTAVEREQHNFMYGELGSSERGNGRQTQRQSGQTQELPGTRKEQQLVVDARGAGQAALETQRIKLGLPQGASASDIRQAELGQSVDTKVLGSGLVRQDGESNAELMTRFLNENERREFNTPTAQYNRNYTRARDERSDWESDRKHNLQLRGINKELQIADMEQNALIERTRLQNELELQRIDKQHEYDMEAYQQGMIGNLLGGIFSLGALL